jgi:hypothetical protein
MGQKYAVAIRSFTVLLPWLWVSATGEKLWHAFTFQNIASLLPCVMLGNSIVPCGAAVWLFPGNVFVLCHICRHTVHTYLLENVGPHRYCSLGPHGVWLCQNSASVNFFTFCAWVSRQSNPFHIRGGAGNPWINCYLKNLELWGHASRCGYGVCI